MAHMITCVKERANVRIIQREKVFVNRKYYYKIFTYMDWFYVLYLKKPKGISIKI